MSTVKEYQDALRELDAAENEWDTLASRIEKTAKLFLRGDPKAFLMEPVESGISVVRPPLRISEWPDAKTLGDLAVRLSDARDSVEKAWQETEDRDKIGLTAPNNRRL